MLTVLTTMGIVGYLGVLSWAMQRSSYEVWGGLLLAPIIIALPLPLVLWVARRDPDPRMPRLIVMALWLKLGGTVLRYLVAYHVYGRGDSTTYHEQGALIASAFRDGLFSVPYGRGGSGTRFLQFVTGWIYTATGPTRFASFLIFSWFGFVGLYFFYQAFRLAFPGGNHRRYAVLIFFLPSLLYWPSILGKEAWMVMGLGITSYGVARLLTSQRGAFLVLGAGIWATAMVRPHVAVLVLAALVAGYLLRQAKSSRALVAKVVGLALLLGGTYFVVARAEGFFGLESFTAESANAVLDNTESRTGQGGSAFAGARVRSPVDLPWAAVTVLFRPFPFEADNVQTAVASLEGLVLGVICLVSVPRLRRLPRELRRTPYVGFAATFTLAFIVAFSSLNNFGILARERVQVYPFVLALLCLPLATMAGDRFGTARRRQADIGEPQLVR